MHTFNDSARPTGAPQAPVAGTMHRRGHSTGSMHHRQLSAGSAVELGRAFDSLLSAAPTKGVHGQNFVVLLGQSIVTLVCICHETAIRLAVTDQQEGNTCH